MTTTDDENQIRTLINRWAEAACSGDLDRVMACYAPDVVAFDAIVALQFRGVDAYRKHWEYCMGFAPGDMLFTIPEMNISVGGDIAYCHFLVSCGCTDEKGNEQTGWMRGTVCLRRLKGQWRIAHEHYSAPFDPESMKALTDLEPE
ncbi:YybH family protein [Microbulbifer halophilus]|uniref:YybH family protein n=2 Tax=Microbulbifer halophilus TaxID=453963 RepID=A0ABW5EC34_9GAMM|nr:SgcJ/EcaC family oxidoreductase [Microbulbifer halophilus]MCW8126031.1 SgcJ/EcaC family oxidoreductase [Microbulbifer halophilus]